MKLRVAPTAGRPQRHVICSVIVSVLAMAAMLLGLFAMHSATSGARHDMSVTASTPAAPAEHPAGANRAVAGAVAAVAVASGMDSGWLSFGKSFMAGCGILALTCAVLLIVVALFRLARQSSVYARLLDAGGLHVRSVRMIPLHMHRPSLTLLSISRI